ncbi:MAG: hypothetical protein ACR2FY_13655 [Pirellulaceae bacterium]
MNRRMAVLAAMSFFAASSVYADYGVTDRGTWPQSWPKELEPLRKQASTLEGPLVLYRHYLIPFTKREEFEAAWPHLLKVKSKGAPIILVRAPKTDFFALKPAGVLIHTPPVGTDQGADDEVQIADAKKVHGPWRTDATYLELVVDGEIVDLNRIRLPADTLIIDERFKDEKKK